MLSSDQAITTVEYLNQWNRINTTSQDNSKSEQVLL